MLNLAKRFFRKTKPVESMLMMLESVMQQEAELRKKMKDIGEER